MDVINHTHTIQWVGPFSFEDYQKYIRNGETASPEYFNFYCFQSRKDGRYRWERYFGVHFKADGIDKRVSAEHEKIRRFKDDRDFQIWIGSLDSPKSQKPGTVDLIETLFIRAYKDVLTVNDKKKKSLPGESVGVINMWFDGDDSLKRYRREKPEFIDDVLLYYEEDNVFYKGELRKMKFPE